MNYTIRQGENKKRTKWIILIAKIPITSLILSYQIKQSDNQKSVGLLGFEPRTSGPESGVLPLHHSPSI